jgi:hypothetical protein
MYILLSYSNVNELIHKLLLHKFKVRTGPGPCGLCGPKVSARDYYGHRVTELNAKLAPKLKEKLAAAATVEAIKSEELRQLHNSQVCASISSCNHCLRQCEEA